MTGHLKELQRAWVIAISIQLFFGIKTRAADIFEADTGGSPGTSWNQSSQWAGGAAPVTGNNYILYTNTSNNSTLSSYYGVSFGTGYIRTPADGGASAFTGDSIVLPPGTEILLKETSGGSASADIVFSNYNNINTSGLYPLVRLAPSASGGTVALNGRIVNLVDSYVANDAGATMTLNIGSTVTGASNLTLVSASAGSFSATRTNLVMGDWSGFSGTLNIGNATVGAVVELNNSAFNANMMLAMPRTDSILILDKEINVKRFSIANNDVPAGTYTPAQLSALGLGGNFSGNGLLTVAPDYPRILKVYLQGGQSNSDGRALTNGLPLNLLQPQADVPLYYYLAGGAVNNDGAPGTLTTLRPGISALGGGKTFGPELTFGRALADYFALTNGVSTNTVMVAIIKYAHGGTSLVKDWVANGNSATNGDGPDYVTFQEVVNAGLSRLATAYPDATIELDGMIWVQGESDIDAGAGASAAYGANLVQFINDVRLTFAANQPYGANLPFFLSRISANQTVYSNPSDPDYPNYLLLRAGQQFAATNLSNVFMVDTDPTQFSTATPWSSPGLHFDTQGQQALGTAFGQSVIKALPAPVLLAPQKMDDHWLLNFTGVSGTLQSVEQSSNVMGPWTLMTNIQIGASRVANWIDSNPPFPAGFYRVSRP